MRKWISILVGACMAGAALADVALDEGIFTCKSRSTVKAINGNLFLRHDGTFRKLFETYTKVNPSDTSSDPISTYEVIEHRGKWAQVGTNLVLSEAKVKSEKRTGRSSDQIQLPAEASEVWNNAGTITIPIRTVTLETFQAQETSTGGWIVWERK